MIPTQCISLNHYYRQNSKNSRHIVKYILRNMGNCVSTTQPLKTTSVNTIEQQMGVHIGLAMPIRQKDIVHPRSIPIPGPDFINTVIFECGYSRSNPEVVETLVFREFGSMQNSGSYNQSQGNYHSITSQNMSIIILSNGQVESGERIHKIDSQKLWSQLSARKKFSSLGIQGFRQYSDKIVETICRDFTKIKQLYLENCGIGDEMLIKLCSIASLVKINVAYNSLTEKGFGKFKDSGITSVVLGSREMEEKTVTGIMGQLQKIQSFQYKTDFNGNSLKALLSTASQLKKLTLNKDIISIIDKEQLRAFVEGHGLRQLTVITSNPENNRISNQSISQILQSSNSISMEDITFNNLYEYEMSSG